MTDDELDAIDDAAEHEFDEQYGLIVPRSKVRELVAEVRRLRGHLDEWEDGRRSR